jgi:hypothetical protein
VHPRSAPELSLLLDAIVPSRPAAVDPRTWDLRQWERGLAAAEWHRLSPVLFRHLGADDAPPAVRARLEESYLANVARNMFLRETIRGVFDTLHTAGVPAIPLKGAILIETVYRDPGLREMWDIDVLVPHDQLAAAERALAAIGFREDPRASKREHLPRGLRAADHHEPALVSTEGLTAVELHHHVAIRGEGEAFDIGEFWTRARPASGFALAPATDDLLLHLALHFTRNRLVGRTAGALAQLCDIVWLVNSLDVDWQRFVTSARSYSLATRIFLALVAAAELAACIPDDVLAELRPARLEQSIVDNFLRLRVLRADEHGTLRPLRRIVLPPRDRLAAGYHAGSNAWPSLARAYVSRARGTTPQVLSAFKRPLLETIRDYRLSGQISTLENRQ